MNMKRERFDPGGIMNKKRILMMLCICVGLMGVVHADQVINIDINTFGDPCAYTGTAAVDDGINQWTVYYGGWGEPAGSPRCADLTYAGDPNHPAGTYGRAVWVGDPGGDHTYQAGTALLDDGFVNDPCTAGNPYFALFGDGGYGGLFDIYVYGDAAGDFILDIPNDPCFVAITKSVTGTTTGFVEGENYVIFDDITIVQYNDVQIEYTNELNGLQLVSKSEPLAILPPEQTLVIDARNYDVAHDTNARTAGDPAENEQYGPDIGDSVAWLDAGEYMIYDVVVDPNKVGEYAVSMTLQAEYADAATDIYIDDVYIGTVSYPQQEDDTIYETPPVLGNFFEGNHTLRWFTPGQQYHNIFELKVAHVGPVNMPTCQDVYDYGFNYIGDITGDCSVDLEDFAVLLADWTVNYDPEGE
ncbi:MAG: hypothetical protein JW860_04435 [Sedimentisphaerales bacterium]|nr:hypothetical protein [Sedimentisphaerales bacterium]